MNIEVFPFMIAKILTMEFYFQLSSYKKRKQMEKHDYEKWKSSVLASNNQNKTEGIEIVFVFSSHFTT